MGTTLQTLDAILKNQYLGPIREQFNNATVLFSRLDKNSESVVGKNFTIPLHYGRNEGIGARSEGAALPDAGNQAYKETIVPMRYLYGRIMLTGPTIKAAKSNQGSFVRAVDSEMKGVVNDLKSALNRQMFGDGSGILATCASASGASVTVDSTSKLRIGMVVDVIKISDGTLGAGVQKAKITGITSSTVFTTDPAVGTAASIDNTYAVYVAGSRNLEIMGLEGIFSDSKTLQGLDVASYPWWKANVLTNGTDRDISEILMQTALDTTEQFSSGKTSAIYTTYGVRRAYQALLQKQKQYVNPLELKGGWKALDYNGLPLIADKDATKGTLYFADESQLQVYNLADIDWMDEDGSILTKVSGYDAYEAVLYSYMELGCSMRNAQTKLEKIKEV